MKISIFLCFILLQINILAQGVPDFSFTFTLHTNRIFKKVYPTNQGGDFTFNLEKDSLQSKLNGCSYTLQDSDTLLLRYFGEICTLCLSNSKPQVLNPCPRERYQGGFVSVMVDGTHTSCNFKTGSISRSYAFNDYNCPINSGYERLINSFFNAAIYLVNKREIRQKISAHDIEVLLMCESNTGVLPFRMVTENPAMYRLKQSVCDQPYTDIVLKTLDSLALLEKSNIDVVDGLLIRTNSTFYNGLQELNGKPNNISWIVHSNEMKKILKSAGIPVKKIRLIRKTC
jgi:hypothetical protein